MDMFRTPSSEEPNVTASVIMVWVILCVSAETVCESLSETLMYSEKVDCLPSSPAFPLSNEVGAERSLSILSLGFV